MAVAAREGLAGEEAGCRRWAVIAAKPLEEIGLPELITAELSGRKDLELVERQKLAEITAELELSAYFGSGRAAERLNLGKLLGADALLILTLEESKSLSQNLARRRGQAHFAPKTAQNEPVPAGLGIDSQPASSPAKAASTGTDREARFVRAVVCECRYGARLRLEYLPYDAERPAELSTACAGLVDAIRSRFAGGIRQCIAVTHFLSRNLTHEHDHLQAGYAQLLEIALMDYPGVAVVETEEARAICRELEIEGEGRLNDAATPLFVEGEYEVTPENSGGEPLVRLSLRASDTDQTRLEVHTPRIPLDEATEQLRTSLAHQIVRLAQQSAQAQFDRQAHYARLTSRADTFSRYGGFQHAIGLREAALLLQPDDHDQRLLLLRDYLLYHRARFDFLYQQRLDAISSADRATREARDRFWKAAHDEQLARLRIIAGHVERVVRSRMLNPWEANRLLFEVFRRMDVVCPPGPGGSKEILSERKAIADDLFWRTYPAFPDLDPGLRPGAIHPSLDALLSLYSTNLQTPSSRLSQYSQWTQDACGFLLVTSPGMTFTGSLLDPRDYSRALNDLFRFLTEVASPDVPLPYMATVLGRPTAFSLTWLVASGDIPIEAARVFCTRLERSARPLPQFYGRLGRLSLQAYGTDGERPARESLDEVDDLVEFVRASDTGDPDYRSRILSFYEHQFSRLRDDLAARIETAAARKRHALPENPIPVPEQSPRLTFEAVQGIEADIVGLQKCTDRLDVAWSPDAVYAVTQRGTGEKIFQLAPDDRSHPFAPRDQILSVQFDGRDLWIACTISGIAVVSPTGRVVARIDAEHGLPPYVNVPVYRDRDLHLPPAHLPVSRALLLYPIAPGRSIAIGTFGEQGQGIQAGRKRVWFALLSVKDDAETAALDIHVFHTATEVPSPDSQDGLHDAFDIAWLASYGSGPRRILVGRQNSAFGGRPLVIDPEVPAVSLFPAVLPPAAPCYGVNDDLIVVESLGITRFLPDEDDPAIWRAAPLVAVRWREEPRLYRQLLIHGSFLVNPGPKWRRIDTGSWQVENLCRNGLPLWQRFGHYALSAHEGVVAWNTGDRFYRVSIDQPAPPEDRLDLLYPYIPADKREAHHRAVQAIRRLGGSVDATWGHGQPWCRSLAAREWRTVVFLDRAWRGGDRGLDHLEGLYNLRDLYLVSAEVSNEGLETVGRLRTLQSLVLVETKATNAGLGHLQGLPELVYLRLEGTAGRREFGDEGLAMLDKSLALERLALYGPGFTNGGLPALEQFPSLHEVFLVDTRLAQPPGQSKNARNWPIRFQLGLPSDERGWLW